MKSLIALTLVFFASPSFGLPIDDLLEDAPQFVRERTEGGLLKLVMWADGAQLGTILRNFWGSPGELAKAAQSPWETFRASLTWHRAIEEASYDAGLEFIRPILLFDVSEAANLRILDYRRNRTRRHLKALMRSHGLSLKDRAEVMKVLATRYDIDLVVDHPLEVVILKPQRLRLLPYGETVLEMLRVRSYAQVEILTRAKCGVALELVHNLNKR